MKGIILFSLMSIIGVNLYSQTQVQWAPSEAIWTYDLFSYFESNPYRGYYKLYNAHDTIVKGTPAKTFDYIIGSIDSALIEKGTQGANDYDPPIIRQEGSKLYRYVRDDFYLLYDFDLEIGDTISIVVDAPIFQVDTMVYLKVTKKEVVNLNGLDRRRMYLEGLEIGNYSYTFYFDGWQYEGIGSLAYFSPADPVLCDYFCLPSLRCYDDSLISLKQIDFGCEEILITSARDEFLEPEKEINVFPNPVHLSESVSIQFPSIINGQVEVEVIDLSGRRIAYKKIENVNHEITFPLDLASSGIYLLIIQTPEFRTISKLTVVD